MRFKPRSRRAAFLLVGLVALAGCVTDATPSGCADPEATLEVVLTADSMRPENLAVCRDQAVTLIVNSATDGYLHIHGYDEAVPIITVTAGGEERVEFTADRSGQFPIELHLGDDPAGIGIGIFTVYEP